MQQMTNWHTCQVCARTIEAVRAEADGWLVGPYRLNPELNVVRCYRHWSEWALRNSIGRTTTNRRKMAEGRRRAEEEVDTMNPISEPFPMLDLA